MIRIVEVASRMPVSPAVPERYAEPILPRDRGAKRVELATQSEQLTNNIVLHHTYDKMQDIHSLTQDNMISTTNADFHVAIVGKCASRAEHPSLTDIDAGAGIGGLALAMSLHKRGVAFTLYEGAKEYSVVG
jgi:hypothetical protein